MGWKSAVSLTNIEVSETSDRPQPPFVADRGKKVPSLNLSKCLYFSLASAIFPRDPPGRPNDHSPYASPNAILPTCPRDDILAHSPRTISSRILALFSLVHFLYVRNSDRYYRLLFSSGAPISLPLPLSFSHALSISFRACPDL